MSSAHQALRWRTNDVDQNVNGRARRGHCAQCFSVGARSNANPATAGAVANGDASYRAACDTVARFTAGSDADRHATGHTVTDGGAAADSNADRCAAGNANSSNAVAGDSPADDDAPAGCPAAHCTDDGSTGRDADVGRACSFGRNGGDAVNRAAEQRAAGAGRPRGDP